MKFHMIDSLFYAFRILQSFTSFLLWQQTVQSSWILGSGLVSALNTIYTVVLGLGQSSKNSVALPYLFPMSFLLLVLVQLFSKSFPVSCSSSFMFSGKS